MWEPIQEMWLKGTNGLYDTLLENATKIQKAFTTFVVDPLKIIIEKFTKAYLASDKIMESLKGIFMSVGRILIAVDEVLSKTFKEGGSLYQKIVGTFGSIALSIAEAFEGITLRMLPNFEVGMMKIIFGLTKMMNLIPGTGIDQNDVNQVSQMLQESQMRIWAREMRDTGKMPEAAKAEIDVTKSIDWMKTLTNVELFGGVPMAAMGTLGWGGPVAGPSTHVLRNPATGERMGDELEGEGKGWATQQAVRMFNSMMERGLKKMGGDQPLISETIKGIMADKEKEIDDGTPSAAETKLEAMWADILATLEIGNEHTKPKEEVPEALDNFASTQAEALGVAITSILLDAKQEHLLRVQHDVLEKLFGIELQTTLQRQLAEDAALTPSNQQ